MDSIIDPIDPGRRTDRVVPANKLDDDTRIRAAALRHIDALLATSDNNELRAEQLSKPFDLDGESVYITNPRKGIFKPRQMNSLLSLKTVYPRGRGRYQDQTEAYWALLTGVSGIKYAFMGKDPNADPNQWLLQAKKNRTPIIYFLGTPDQVYLVIRNAYITEWNPDELYVSISIGLPGEDSPRPPEDEDTRKYTTSEVLRRAHQSAFRHGLLRVYNGRCALTGMRERFLLDAAHIMPDKDPAYGQPVVQNGLLLLKTHHAAFDKNLIGITPDYEIRVSDRLLQQKDGPTLKALQGLHEDKLKLPRQKRFHPDRDRLAMRYAEFERAN